MTFEVTILGSGSALPTSRRYPTAQALNVLERFFLVDCGEGTQQQLRNSHARFGKINNIFISHLHGDHVFGIFGLLSSFNLLGRKTDLCISGPEGIAEIIDFFCRTFAQDLQFLIHIKILKVKGPEIIFEDKAVEVFAFPLKHRVSTCGYLFREKLREPNIQREAIEKYKLGIKDMLAIKRGEPFFDVEGNLVQESKLIIPPPTPRSYAFCSDTAYYERLIPWIKGVDLLYHEATFASSEHKIAKQTQHSTAKQAATIALKAEVKKLLIGHFSNRYMNTDGLLLEAKSIFPETYIASELNAFSITNT